MAKDHYDLDTDVVVLMGQKFESPEAARTWLIGEFHCSWAEARAVVEGLPTTSVSERRSRYMSYIWAKRRLGLL